MFLPTTRAQVSGHRFLRRRVEHGLVFGDIRMIHDPLRARARGLIFGAVAVVLGMLGAGLFAWLNPQASPGDAVVLRSTAGQLYVRIDDRVHPVDNLASARLIAGSPVEPAAIGDKHLRDVDKGTPVGVSPAPSLIDPRPTPATWSACSAPDGTITVRAHRPPAPLATNTALLHEDWLITADGRTQLPDPSSPAGRAVARALGITDRTPRVDVPPEILSAIPELRPIRVPDPLPLVVETSAGDWARTGDTVTRLTDLQSDILRTLGAPTAEGDSAELLTLIDADPLALPAAEVRFVGNVDKRICARDDGGVGLLDGTHTPGTTQLAGGVAAGLVGLAGGAVAVDTGNGLHVVDTTGLIHDTDHAGLAALGYGEPQPTDWAILTLLPEGPDLYVAESL